MNIHTMCCALGCWGLILSYRGFADGKLRLIGISNEGKVHIHAAHKVHFPRRGRGEGIVTTDRADLT